MVRGLTERADYDVIDMSGIPSWISRAGKGESIVIL